MSGCCSGGMTQAEATGLSSRPQNDCSTGEFTSCIEVDLPPVRNEFQQWNQTTEPVFKRIANNFGAATPAGTVRAAVIADPATQTGVNGTTRRFNSGAAGDYALAPPAPPETFNGTGAKTVGGVVGIPVDGSYDFTHQTNAGTVRTSMWLAGPYATPGDAATNGPGDAVQIGTTFSGSETVTQVLTQGYYWIDQIVWNTPGGAGFSVMSLAWACTGLAGGNNIPTGNGTECPLSPQHPGFSPGTEIVPVTCTVESGSTCINPGTTCRRDDNNEIVPTGSIAPCP